jgi:hypothetical protein
VTRAGFKRRNRIKGQFAWRLIEMLKSPTYQVLSRGGHQFLARLESSLAPTAAKLTGGCRSPIKT